ncbi:hypothetical protein FHS09_002674 [Microbulbifer rhizosphaerae]|uniref:Uncharacterized protein n=1 Tax=Microbulbifer rhizosphaerae TaxID=1562603 RepID=A0A7W4WCQ0_9GAMM|nr:hypothetical protein [Microbulbifer rhizosphaerae]
MPAIDLSSHFNLDRGHWPLLQGEACVVRSAFPEPQKFYQPQFLSLFCSSR